MAIEEDIQNLKSATREAHEMLQEMKELRREMEQYAESVKEGYAEQFNQLILKEIEKQLTGSQEILTKSVLEMAESSRTATREAVKRALDETRRMVLEFVNRQKAEIEALKRTVFD